MTRFLNYLLLTILFSISLTACTSAEDKDAYLSSLRLSAMVDEIDPNDNTEVINIDLEVDLELNPDFEPRTKIYTASASCVTDSVNIFSFAAYPRLNITVNDITPESTITPVNINTPFGTTNIQIYLSGDSYIETTYNLSITRGMPGDLPAIRLLGGLIVNHTLDVPYVDALYEACDSNDTDITTDVVIGGGTDELGGVDHTNLGTYTLTYDVIDSNGLAAIQVIRTVNVVENTSPTITLLGNATETVLQNEVYVDAGASASDPQEGDISASITTNGTDIIDTSATGTQTVTYDVIDAGALSAPQVTRTVEIIAAP